MLPVVVLVSSVLVLVRYADGFEPELWIVLGLGVLAFFFIGLVMVRRSRWLDNAQRSAQEIALQHPDAHIVLALLERAEARAIRTSSGVLGLPLKADVVIATLADDRVVFRAARDRQVVAELVVGFNLAGFTTEMLYRGNPIDQPCLRLLFLGGNLVDVVLYDVSTGKMLTAEAVRHLPRTGEFS
ncbi:MAG: hypothetical protein C0444_07485 [Microbacterium sp.]|nr:hypothetical protein [Microbacterium sp.]MBA4346131.1 hypothetical protein [Microbacterium sp.]